MRQEKITVSIIIPVFNKLEYTTACIDSIYRHTPAGSQFEVIVVDNGSSDGTPGYLREAESRFPRLRVVMNKTNLGFARACNQGAEAAGGEYLLFLNNDTEVRENWLPPLVTVLETDSYAAAVGSKLLFPDGTIQHAGVVLLQNTDIGGPPSAAHCYYRRLNSLRETHSRRCFQVLTAACLMVRAEVFRRLKGFDTGFKNGYEDVDLCLRIGRTGGRLVFQPQSEVIHHEFGSGYERFTFAGDNLARFRKKWAARLTPDYLRTGGGPYRLNPKAALNLGENHGLPKTLSLRALPPSYVSAEFFLLGEKAREDGKTNWRYYYKRALALLLSLETKNGPDYYRIASIYKRLGRLRAAEEWFLKVVDETTDTGLIAGVHFHLGEIMMLTGDRPGARAFFEKCLDADPKHRKAREYLAERKRK